MEKQEILEVIEGLRDGSIESYHVAKEDFMTLRAELIKCEDFQSFRGNAQVGGAVIFTYEPGWTK
ncbi:hypothetical protein BpOF4_21249 (plasmid) [Alkalihalophilus pseudofirmus OF4]|uniref:Uncharacterized protein n=1 Tax=Alkalihalophilus pseudofirmus (strain ATCC BAA-2126 / JCM 17055 / OF4) TaxID=398511 RepID=D3G1L9_ALKPO|nr:hypothetical protein [Alkalihalophilus pseudofirmus]ADC52245.1 hypothetical protein BpOF4_21249 [Alkalihalophilus pseudofirmus OF4]